MKTKYGLPVNQYEEIRMAETCQIMYGLSDELSEYALSLARSQHYDIEKTYYYVWSYIFYCGNEKMQAEKVIKRLNDKWSQYLFFACNKSIKYIFGKSEGNKE